MDREQMGAEREPAKAVEGYDGLKALDERYPEFLVEFGLQERQ